MRRNTSHHCSFAFLIITQLLFSLVFPVSFSTAAQPSAITGSRVPGWGAALLFASQVANLPLRDSNNRLIDQASVLQQADAEPTTLVVQIVSSPYAVIDANDPTGIDGPVPQVFLVEAVITNTGTTPAENLTVSLDYHEDPATGWILLEGENPVRRTSELGINGAMHAYWFTRFPLVANATHVYTVTAQADNADPVAVSDNFYGNLAPGATVEVRGALNTGNTAVVSAFKTSSEFILGSTFTATVDYSLPNSPRKMVFNPVGTVDFPPDAYRLIASTTRFYNDAGTQSHLIADRLYFDVLPDFAENAEVSYTFLIFGTKAANLCPYTAGYSSASAPKYNNDYCQETSGTIIPVEGTLNLELSQDASSPVIQQSQVLTYTLHYTNTGTLPLSDIWIWDAVDPNAGDILDSTIEPPADSGSTTAQLVAWHFDTIPIEGTQGSSGELTFSVLVDGHGLPLPDGTPLVNHAYVGAGVDGLPTVPVYTSTLTTFVQAPSIEFSKSDGLLTTQPGDPLTYTLEISNSGSVPAGGLVISDVLPAHLSVAGTIMPPPDQQDGQTLVWNNLDPLAVDGTTQIKIPVVSAITTPDGTVLSNAASVTYQNPSGFQYPAVQASDDTTVQGPVLAIEKSAAPDPAVAGAILTYTLAVSNSGPGAASHVVVTDTVPENTTYLSCSGEESCVEHSGVVQWNLGSLEAYGYTSVAFVVQVDENLTTGSYLLNDDYWVASDQTARLSGEALSTLVNREAAFVQGYAFVDLNLNGVFDAGEAGFPGLEVTLPDALQTSVATDGNGFYAFRVETQVPVSVSIDLPAGYMSTTPEVVILPELVFGETSVVNFGMVTAAPENSVVFGTVFNDANHDGMMDLGEQGLTGVTVSSTDALNSPVTTNDLGQYTLQFESDGVITVTETDLPTYVSTTPNEASATAMPGTGHQVDFGDFQGIEIRGQVFQDANANGQNDAEAGLPGALISAGGESFATTTSGQYSLFVAIQDSSPLLVSETDPSGYVSTGALPGGGASLVDANTLSIDNPTPGTVYTGNDFGDTRPVDLAVSKQASSSALAAGMPLTYTLNYSNLSSADALAVTLTDTLPDEVIFTGMVEQNPELPSPTVDGQVLTWSIAEIPAHTSGNLSFSVLVKPSATGSFTNFVEIAGIVPETDLENNQDSVVTDIGVPSAATIYGNVFDDLNGNGVQDTGEQGLPGVTVTLDGASPVTTAQDGSYYFVVSKSGVYRVVESNPSGYFSTTPDEVHVNVTLGESYPVHFGNAANSSAFVTIWGTVFNDANANSSWETDEYGLPGVIVTRDGVEPVTTNAYGGFTIVLSSPGAYTLVENDPPGYSSTTPNQVVVDTVLGHQYQVNFGDTTLVKTSYQVVLPMMPKGPYAATGLSSHFVPQGVINNAYLIFIQ